MIAELIKHKQYLESYYHKSFTNRIKEIISNRRNYNNKLFKILNNQILNQQQFDLETKNSMFAFINWLKRQHNFVVIYKYPHELNFRMVKTDFSLLAQVALSFSTLAEFPQQSVLELHYLVAVKDGLGVGSEFLHNFVSFSNEINMPIILYCEENLVNYYKKRGFTENGRNFQGYYLMVHYPLKNS